MPPTAERVQVEIRGRLFADQDDRPVAWEVVRYARGEREVLSEGVAKTHAAAWRNARRAARTFGVEVGPCP